MRNRSKFQKHFLAPALAGLLFLGMTLTGCGSKVPATAADGSKWDSSWTTVGEYLGVEVPDGYREERNEGIMLGARTFYYVWVKGEGVTYTNDSETELTSYDAQIHILANETNSEEEAAEAADSWQALSDERYTYSDQFTVEYAGQEFDVTVYDRPDDGGPAATGASATAVRDNWAIHVDIISTTEEAPEEILADFLEGLHYAK